MDNRFPSPEQSAHSGYQRSTAKRDQVETSFPERTPHPAYVRAFSRSDRVDAGISSLEEQKPYTGYLTRSDRAERGFSTRGNSATPNKDVYPQTADKHEKTERGFPNRPTSNSLHKDLRQQAANKDSKTDRGVSLRSNVDSPGKDVYPQTTTRLEKTDRGFSNRPTLNSPNKELYSPTPDKPNKPDLLNFKKGWMSILGDSGEWKKHWFVLTDSSLRYYRDSTAEEANDLDGEIDLRNCSNVTEHQVQRNYGFQIHTKEMDYTLSAMTSGIRRNWIEALRKNVRPSSSPDVTKRNSWMKPPPSKASLTDSNKENTFCDAIARRTAVRQEATAADRTWADVQRGSRRTDAHLHQPPSQDCVELAPVQQQLLQSLRAPDSAPARVQESAWTRSPDSQLRGQGCTKGEELKQEQVQRLSERSKWFEAGVPSESPRGEADWSFVPVQIPQPLGKDIEVKWQELECIPLRDHKQVPLLCLRPSQTNAGTAGTTERLKKEIQSLNAQLDEARKELESFRGQTGRLQGQLCASEDQRKAAPKGYVSQATCERSFKEMEESHRKAMEEQLRQHKRELERMQQDKDRLLSEETSATIAAIEAVKKAHREELEKETDKLRSKRSIVANSDLERLNKQHQDELLSLQEELQVLSEQYSRKCLEIDCQVKETQLREKDLCRSQRENKELLRQNQELNGQLSDEIARIRDLVTRKSQDHTANLSVTGDRGSCELEMLLRVKENEVQNMRKETECLRDELQTMQWDKKYATDRYNDIFVELSVMKVKTERELSQVKEQLKLALSALKEKESLQNSIAK
ncbi:TRIO and F-actin-binding protein isoform X3 [Amblyraja radiata]|uniref:TRIO and F-actin-binding protein isoform X3 n=1 Tax=Amblyraja radiata TaxID=386614 RepID=UPI0014039E48|nr:TRIO and F-actin-binding protein isoform X3 [Amblyraja radiata]